MLEFLTANFGTIIVASVLALILIGIILKISKDKKSGKGSCGCGCSNCPSAGMCQSYNSEGNK